MNRYDVEPAVGGDAQIGLLKATWQDSTREWRKNLGDVEEAAIVWQPYSDAHSIGAVLLHMIACENYWIVKDILQQEVDPDDPAIRFDREVDQYSGTWPAPPAQPLSWYYAMQDANRAEVFALIDGVGDPALVRVRPDRYEFTLRWVMAHLIEHDSYHGGQLVLLKELWLHRKNSN